MFRSTILLVGAGLAGLAAAQSISSQCTASLATVVANAPCLNLNALVPLVVSNSTSTSIIPTVDTWLTGLCAQGPCTNATLQAVVANITTGCASDLAGLGISSSNSAALTTEVESFYPGVRQVVCLKDTTASTLCVTELLTGVQSATTTLTLNNFVGLISSALSGTLMINLPQNVTCSNCMKAAYTIVGQDYPGLLTNQSAVQSVCGASFTDGQMPGDIKETAVNTTSSKNNNNAGTASLSISSLNAGAAMLIGVFSAFAFFA